MTHLKPYLRTAAVAIAVLASATSARASLIAYEGFDYAPGSALGGLAGGFGWTTAWIGSGTADNSQIVAGSFVYDDGFGNVVTASGNRLHSTGDGITDGLVGAPSANSSQSPRRLLPYQGTVGNSSTWVSFMALRTGNPDSNPPSDAQGSILYNRAAGVQLFYNATSGSTAQGSELISIGRATQTAETALALPNDTWGLVYKGGANFSSATTDSWTTPTKANSTADFILMRIDHVNGVSNPFDDSVSIWLNPRLDDQNLLGAADLTLLPGAFADNDRDLAFNVVRVFAGNYSGTSYGSIEVDEFKVGTAFGDVTLNAIPEPTALALLGLGGLAFINRIRRK
jgi:hypothetical protein